MHRVGPAPPFTIKSTSTMTSTMTSADPAAQTHPTPVARPAGKRWADMSLTERFVLARLAEEEVDYDRRVLRELEAVRGRFLDGDLVRRFRTSRRASEMAAADLAAAEAALDLLLQSKEEAATDADLAAAEKSIKAAVPVRDRLALSAAAFRSAAAADRAAAEQALAAALAERLRLIQSARPGDAVLRAVEPAKLAELARLD